jgi:hypothetical protein
MVAKGELLLGAVEGVLQTLSFRLDKHEQAARLLRSA